MGPNKKCPAIKINAIKYKINDGQKPEKILTAMATARKKIPSGSLYFIITFKNFIHF